jgi:hypothetical protein
MFVLFISLALLGFLFMVYQRIVPVTGIPTVDLHKKNENKKIVLVDVRDYHIATKHPVEDVTQLPFAYVKRHYREIKSKDIVIVVSDQLLLNLSVRFFKSKGFNIIGYHMTRNGSETEYKEKQIQTKHMYKCKL